MAPANLALHVVQKLVATYRAGQLSDGQLLERFAASGDEAAFTALVEQHGPMVLRVCRRVLHEHHAAEDAFQSTFLVLARKASNIGRRELLASWLHGVAYRVACHLRADAARRQQREAQTPPRQSSDPLAEVTGRDLCDAIDAELERLPLKYRTPLLLCCLEGKTRDEVAGQLGWSLRTLKRRLERGRELLRARLSGRGVTFSATLLATMLSPNASTAAVPAPLAHTAVTAALTGVGSPAAKAALSAALPGGVLRAMSLTRWKIALILLLLTGALGLGTLVRQAGAQKDNNINEGTKPQVVSPKKSPQPTPAKGEQGEEMTVAGQVLDVDGKTVPAAPVAILAWAKPRPRHAERLVFPSVLAQGKTDAKGRYTIAAPRTSKEHFWGLAVVARSPGYGLGVRYLDPDVKAPEAQVRLVHEMILTGRLIDLQGQPVAGAKVHTSYLSGKLTPDGRGGPIEFLDPPMGLLAWPQPAISDAQGRFTLRGIGSDWSVHVQVTDDRFARQTLVINPKGVDLEILREARLAGGAPPVVELKFKDKDKKTLEEFTWVLSPARFFEGTVTYADTKKPVAKASVVVFAGKGSFSLVTSDSVRGQTDAEGRFKINSREGKYFELIVTPPAGQPYFLQTKMLQWSPKAEIKKRIDFALPRGVTVSGKVIEKSSGKPVAGASIEFVPRRVDNPFFKASMLAPAPEFKQVGISGPDGSFTVAALPGPGHLLVLGPTLDYLRAETSARQLGYGKAGGRRMYPNAFLALDLKPETKKHEVTLTLRRGVTIKGRLEDPDGKPVREAVVFCPWHIPLGYSLDPVREIYVRDGTFELPGCDPENPQPVYILDSKHQLGTIVKLPDKEAAKEPVTIRLKKCGTMTVRFVDPEGKPVENFHAVVEVQLTPGIIHNYQDQEKLLADTASMSYLDWQRHQGLKADAKGRLDWQRHQGLKADAKGRFTFPTLIPGATFRLIGGMPTRGLFDTGKTFTVEPGQTLDLKEITIEPK
jgi:RNA polymerase sigma factor (sigma-70 family)